MAKVFQLLLCDMIRPCLIKYFMLLFKKFQIECPNHHFVLSADLCTYCFKIELTFYCYITKPAIINIGHKDVKVGILVSFLSNCRKTALHSQSEGVVHITRRKSTRKRGDGFPINHKTLLNFTFCYNL